MEEIGRRLGAFGKKIKGRAQDAYDIVRLNTEISAKTHELTELHTELGKAYCEKHLGDESPEFPALIEKARELTNAVQALNATLVATKGLQTCPSCGAAVEAGDTFCSVCGAKLAVPTPEPQPAAGGAVCRACGAALLEGDLYCPECGARQRD